MAVAVFTLASFLFANTAKVFAESFNADKYDAGWRYYKVNQSHNGGTDADNGACSPFVDLNATAPDSFHAGVGTKKYSEYLSIANLNINSTSGYLYNYTIESDSEIVMFFDYSLNQSNHDFINEYLGSNKQMGRPVFYFLSKSGMVGSYKEFSYNGTSFSLNTTSSTMGWNVSKTYNDMTYYYADGGSSYPYFAINSHKMKVFDSFQEALTYLQTGIGKPAWEGSDVAGYDGNVHFDTFEIIPQDSNSYDAFYFEFRYEIPFDMLNSSSYYYLDIDSTFEWTACILADGIRMPETHSGVNRINLLDYPSGFKLYLDDIEAIQKFYGDSILSGVFKRQVLGSEGVIDLGLLSVGGVGGDTMGRITNSKIYLDCVLVCDGICGKVDHYDYDFLKGGGNYYSSTPDSDGNYTPNDDYKHTGYYYTDIGTDAAGNTTYNYYYYGDDNSRHEISAEDSHNNTFSPSLDIGSGGGGGGSATGDNSNNNVNNPTFNNNNNVTVTVEGDSINNDVNNIINNDTSNSKENSENFITKFLGFFNVLENNSFLSILGKLFGWLPAPVYAVITGSIGIIAGVSVFRFFHK